MRLWSWDNYDIEELWDHGCIEVSTDGGSSWTQLQVRDEPGNVVSTYDDPNGRLDHDQRHLHLPAVRPGRVAQLRRLRQVAGNHRWVLVRVHATRADNTP